jgi:hypothetical protein
MRKLLILLLFSIPSYATSVFYEFIELKSDDYKKLKIFASNGNRSTEIHEFFVHAPNSLDGNKLQSISLELWQDQEMLFSSLSEFSIYNEGSRSAFPVTLKVDTGVRVKATLCYANKCLEINSVSTLPIKDAE